MCKLCELKPVYEFTNQRKLCKNCFVRWFEKKFFYTIRRFQMISKNDKIGYENKKDFRNIVLIELLELLEQRSPVEIVAPKGVPSASKNVPSAEGKEGRKKANKIAVADTIDVIAKEFIKNSVNKTLKNNLSPVDKKIIKPLYLFLDKEVLIYAKIKGLKFNKIKKEKDKWFDFIENLEKKHPEIKRGIVNSYLELFL